MEGSRASQAGYCRGQESVVWARECNMGDDETPYLLVSASPDNAIDSLYSDTFKGRFHYYL